MLILPVVLCVNSVNAFHKHLRIYSLVFLQTETEALEAQTHSWRQAGLALFVANKIVLRQINQSYHLPNTAVSQLELPESGEEHECFSHCSLHQLMF